MQKPTIDHFRNIYEKQSESYDQLVSKEDFQGNILKSLKEKCTLSGKKVVELGAGTGRLTHLLAPLVDSILAFDESQQMLFVAKQKLEKAGFKNWKIAIADNRNLPVFNDVADISIAGWTLGHLTETYSHGWQQEITQAIQEMQRVLKPGGIAVILETLGTGRMTPAAPSDALSEFYSLLENKFSFKSMHIRTDYKFSSIDEAEGLMRFFFGEELAMQVREQKQTVVPEFTGIWTWKR